MSVELPNMALVLIFEKCSVLWIIAVKTSGVSPSGLKSNS